MDNLENFFFKQACLASTFSQDHPALILNFKSLAFNPLSWPGTLHHLFWGFVITESTCRVLQHFKLSVDKNQNNYNFHKLKTAIQTLQPHLTPIFHNKSLQRECFSCTRVLFLSATGWSVGSQKDHGHQASSHPTTQLRVAGWLYPWDALPTLGLGEALLDATTGGTVTEEEENGLFQQLNRSEKWRQGGMAIPARTTWAMFHVQKASPLYAWVDIKDFLLRWANKKSIRKMVFV